MGLPVGIPNGRGRGWQHCYILVYTSPSLRTSPLRHPSAPAQMHLKKPLDCVFLYVIVPKSCPGGWNPQVQAGALLSPPPGIGAWNSTSSN